MGSVKEYIKILSKIVFNLLQDGCNHRKSQANMVRTA